jgi:hypothetical protein
MSGIPRLSGNFRREDLDGRDGPALLSSYCAAIGVVVRSGFWLAEAGAVRAPGYKPGIAVLEEKVDVD